MKTTTISTRTKLLYATGILSVAAMTVMAGPPVIIVPPPPPPIVVAPPPPPPPVVVQPPIVPAPPAVSVSIGVPDSYAWDGYEYVGVMGDQYYYLGPDRVWLRLDGDRFGRFHTWERTHHDWRDHAVRNELYRHDAQGHDHPWAGGDHGDHHDRDFDHHDDHHDRH